MIRRAVESDFVEPLLDESALRIHSLKRAYGLDVSFVQYFSDGCGGLLSVMDGTAILSCASASDEWVLFVTMNPDILRVHCSAGVGKALIATQEWQGRDGVVLQYKGVPAAPTVTICESPYLPTVHTLLSECFEGMSSLDAWYPDVSHRLRHNCAQIATICDGTKVVSTAMTVAETDNAALIGQVATDSEYRGRGYAKSCINSLISRCKGKLLYILPMTDIARSIYENMGFVPCDEWAELQRI